MLAKMDTLFFHVDNSPPLFANIDINIRMYSDLVDIMAIKWLYLRQFLLRWEFEKCEINI